MQLLDTLPNSVPYDRINRADAHPVHSAEQITVRGLGCFPIAADRSYRVCVEPAIRLALAWLLRIPVRPHCPLHPVRTTGSSMCEVRAQRNRGFALF